MDDVEIMRLVGTLAGREPRAFVLVALIHKDDGYHEVRVITNLTDTQSVTRLLTLGESTITEAVSRFGTPVPAYWHYIMELVHRGHLQRKGRHGK